MRSTPARPRPDRVRGPTRDLEKRLEEIVSTIQEFAELRFNARAPIGPDGNIADAVAAGVNFLDEELDAAFREIERRVADRTAQLTIATEDLARRALHDELTGLPNRALFWEHLVNRLRLAGRRQSSFAVLYIDVDHFKAVNDSLGHVAGDRLLVDLAARLRGALRAGDIAARVGGDEFVMLLDHVATEEATLVVAERLRDVVLVPCEIGVDHPIVTVSIGVAVGPANFRAAEEVVAAADAAMYHAKRLGGGRCALHGEDRRSRSVP